MLGELTLQVSLRCRVQFLSTLCLCLAILLTIGSNSSAREEASLDVLRLKAEGLARAGRCEEAKPLFLRVQEMDPQDARAARTLGECAIANRDYVGAAEFLAQAKQLDPNADDVDLYLGIALYHMDDFAGARIALAEAREKGSEAPQLDLYDGLLLLQQANAREAAAAFERARRADPSMEMVASYYEGLAWFSAKDKAQARASLERVIATAPGTVWAEQAERVLADYSAKPVRRWLTASLGVEYDDNVVLKGDGVRLPQELSDDSDVRGVLTMEGGAELVKTETQTVGVLGSYYGSVHDDLDEFDVQYPTLGTWWDYSFSEDTVFRIQYDIGYAWLDTSDSYLFIQTATPALYQDWGDAGTSRFFARITRENFKIQPDDLLLGPPGVDEEDVRDRDGYDSWIGVDHTYPLGNDTNVALQGGYRYRYHTTEGQEWDADSHEGRLGLVAILPWDVRLDTTASFEYRSFRHSSSYQNKDGSYTGANRLEKDVRFAISFEKPVMEDVSMSLRYTYNNVDSNVDVFDFDRNIVGLYATVRF